MTTSVQRLNIIVWLDGLIRCLLMMEFHMRIVENVLQTSCILLPFVMSVILHGHR